MTNLPSWRRKCCPTWIRSGRCSTASGARQAHPVRRRAGRAARHRPRHLPLRDLLQHGSGAGGDRLRPRPTAIDYVLGICKAYTTRVGRGPVPHRPAGQCDRRRCGERGREFGTVTGRPAAAAGLMPCWCARPCAPAASTAWRSPSSTSSTASTRSRCASAIGSTAANSTICPPANTRRREFSRLRDRRRLEGADGTRAQLGAIAGAGHQIRAPDRGTGRLSGGPALDQSGARGHHSGAESVRGVIRFNLRVGSGPEGGDEDGKKTRSGRMTLTRNG